MSRHRFITLLLILAVFGGAEVAWLALSHEHGTDQSSIAPRSPSEGANKTWQGASIHTSSVLEGDSSKPARTSAGSNRIAGRVFDDNLKAIPGAQVRLLGFDRASAIDSSHSIATSTSSRILAETLSDAGGNFDLGEYPIVNSQTLYIYCHHPGYGERSITPNQGEPTQILMSPSWITLRVAGTVVDTNQVPVAEFSLHLERRHNRKYSSASARDIQSRAGRFDETFEVPSSFIDAPYLVASAPRHQSAVHGPLAIREDHSAEGITLTLSNPRSAIGGFVFSEQGDGLGDVRLSAVAKDGRPAARGTSEGDGSFTLPLFSEFEGLLVYAEKAGYSPEWVPFLPALEGNKEIIVVLRDAATLIVRMRSHDDAPISKARMVAWANRRFAVSDMRMPQFYAVQPTDDSGEATFANVPYGEVNVAISEELGRGSSATYPMRHLTRVTISKKSTEIELVRPQGVVIRGMINIDQLPDNAAIWIALSVESNLTLAYMASTNRKPFMLRDMPDGDYALRITVSDSAFAESPVHVAGRDVDLGDIAVNYQDMRHR